MKNTLSVIIPARNEENYIGITIKSILDNKINHELIVICDSCSDNTKKIAREYTKKVYEVGFENVSKTRNYGAKKSKGNILIFIDADTVISKSYLDRINNCMRDFDYGAAKWQSERGNIFGRFFAWNLNRHNKLHKTVNGNLFVKKKIFDKVGGFDEALSKREDTDLGERIRDTGAKFIYLKNIKQIPSERRYRDEGFLRRIYNIQKESFLHYKEVFCSKKKIARS